MQIQPIVGAWHVAIKIEGNAKGFDAIYTFYADGNFLDVNSLREANPGVWSETEDTYIATFWGFGFDMQGQTNAKAKVRLAIKMEDADHFTANGRTDVYDLAGRLIEHEFSGPVTLEGVRAKVESPLLDATS
ncbi:MAG: hypothetical protein M9936_30675 [Caldilinea sp.]|nr:hypothetical protein [Caldilinea sp.]MCB0058711.1 hypothetical protein [Caldilineaceae bacterium]MCB0050891.1 hypothetical protein [Caldilinea sp.]MCB0069352.1 hypothetical protein [Caldilineaceae bacterium]MCB0149743.1 hypothetical protein [Caldilineaceae bacterium]